METLVTYFLTSRSSRSWEANRFLASRGIPLILWSPNVHLPHSQVSATWPYPEPDRSSPCHHFLKIHLSIILPSRTWSSKWSLSFRFLSQNRLYASNVPHSAKYATCLNILDFFTRTIFGEGYRSLSSSLCNFLHCPFTSSLLGKIFSSTPHSQTPSTRVPPSMWTSKFHTHTTQ